MLLNRWPWIWTHSVKHCPMWYHNFRIRHWVFSNIRISSLENTSLIYYLKLFPRWHSSFFPLGSATARCNLWNSLHTHHGSTLPPFGDVGLFKSIYLLFILPYKCFFKVALYFSLNVFAMLLYMRRVPIPKLLGPNHWSSVKTSISLNKDCPLSASIRLYKSPDT